MHNRIREVLFLVRIEKCLGNYIFACMVQVFVASGVRVLGYEHLEPRSLPNLLPPSKNLLTLLSKLARNQ